MSRTFHTRPRRTRADPTISAKKPDEGRRWTRRNVLRGTLPLRDARRIDPATPIDLESHHSFDHSDDHSDDKDT